MEKGKELMENFTFYAPTKVYFGKNTQKEVGGIIREYGFQKVMIHFGGESAKKSGLLDEVMKSLERNGIDYVLYGGVSPNPVLSFAEKGKEICIEENIDLILAVGGGSVIDSAKCIADWAGNPEKNAEEIWKYFQKEDLPQKALPVGVILTLAASGSEMSASCVITNENGWLKRGFNSETHRPLFAIMNPELTYSVGPFQTACGIVDIMMHTLERYFCINTGNEFTDRLDEALLKSVIHAGRKVMKYPRDYDARANLMWAGSWSHNDLTGTGRTYLMRVHQLEHEVSGMYPEIAHGAGLSALFCSWARFMVEKVPDRFAQYAVRVWDCEINPHNILLTAQEGIDKTESFFRELNMPVSLKELHVKPETMEEMAEKCTFFGKRVLTDYITLGKEEIYNIFEMAYNNR